MNTRLAAGGQLVNMRPPKGVEPMLENANNLTMLVKAALLCHTGEIDIGSVEANQSGRSHTSWGLTKKRWLAIQEPLPRRAELLGRRQLERRSNSGWGLTKKRSLAIQEPFPSRPEHVGKRQLERNDLAKGSLPESREHVSQRLPFANIPVKKRRLAYQEPLPSRKGSTRGGGKFMNIRPPASGEPIIEHRNPRPLTRVESELGPVIIRAHAEQHIQKTRSSMRIKARPGRPLADPRLPTGGEPMLGPVSIRTSARHQDLSTRSSASSKASLRRPLANKRHPARWEGRPHLKSSAYKGVTKYRRTRRWEANIWRDGKQTYLGASPTEIQAARAYDRALIHFRGEEAKLNFNLDHYRGELTQLSNVKSEDLVHILRKQSKGPGASMPDYTYRQKLGCRSSKIPIARGCVKFNKKQATNSPCPVKRATVGPDESTSPDLG